MEARRFDSVVKALGSGTSRRQVLRRLLGSSVAGAAVVSWTFETTAKRKVRAQRGKPSGKGKQCTSGLDCPTRQVCNDGACRDCVRHFDNPEGSFACKGTNPDHGGDCCGPFQDEEQMVPYMCCICAAGFGQCKCAKADCNPQAEGFVECEYYAADGCVTP